MHEMSICLGIIDTLEQEAQKQDFRKVKHILLQIGALAGVEISALTFSFEIAAKNSIADGADLRIETLEAQAWCSHCEKAVPIQHRYDPCPICNGYGLLPTQGEDMRIKQIEVE